MRGIDGAPYIGLDSYLDLKVLDKLTLQVYAGVVRAEMQLTAFGGLRDNNVNELYQIERLAKNKGLSEDLQEHYDSLNTINSQREFLSIVFDVPYRVWSIYLRKPDLFIDKQQSSKNVDKANCELFPDLMDFIYKLPFRSLGRVVLFFNDAFSPTPCHRDHTVIKNHNEEFLWISLLGDKKIYIYNDEQGEQILVRSKSAFFNANDYHGSVMQSGPSVSLRVDGFFTDEFKKTIGIENLKHY